MKDIDEIDRMFRMLRDMMDGEFSGGYYNRDINERPHSSYNDKADIQEDENSIYITLELRVQEEDIQVTALEDKLVVEVMLEGAWKRNNLKLPSLVNPKSMVTSFNNYVLDIKLDKKKDIK
jgi:HSP20 family molecular chaperone IbpA